VAGDRDSGIANCNNYVVGSHPPQPSSPKADPASPLHSPAQLPAEPSSPVSRSGSQKSTSPTPHPADVPLELCSGPSNLQELSVV